MTNSMRSAAEHTFVTHDGTELFYRCWPATNPHTPARAIVLLHRGHEHSGRLQHVVDELELPEYTMFAWDARGHGRSPGARGDSPSFSALVKDLDRFVRHITTVHAILPENIAVIAQSVAAVLTATWVHDYAPRVRCLTLTAPAFKVKLYVPLARQGLALIHRVFGNFFVTSYVKAKFLTHDAERIRSYEEDPLIARAISARILLGLYDTAERIVADAQAIRTPVQLLVSDTDWVVHRAPQEVFFARLGSPIKERHLLDGFLHDTLGERDRKRAIAKVRDFIMRMFAAPLMPQDVNATPHTVDEEQRLRASLPTLSLRNLNFAATRLSMRTLGRLARGIRLGLATGFDSGATLDYVYRNEARGAFGIGTLIDRGYLDAIGWRGIRLRKRHVELAITEAAERLRTAGKPVHIADIGAGHGRYVLDAAERMNPRPEAIVLRDYDASNVEAGRAAIAMRGLATIARFEQADAFDADAVAAIEPRPTIIIVSGLYELFSNNAEVTRSLQGVARALPPGGFLVYTGQPWHPQLELIARTLTSHRNGAPWVMRRRPQAELDALVGAAGFAKVEQWIDDWGIFTVSLAVRS